MKLYELSGTYAEVQQQIEDGADPEVLADTLDAIREAIEQKVESIYRIRQNLQAEIDALKAEEKRLAEKRRALESQQEWLKAYTESQLILAGVKKVKTSIGTVAFRKAPPSVEIIDIQKIDDAYLIKQEPKVNKRAILQAWKEKGEKPCDGVHIVDDKITLQFR